MLRVFELLPGALSWGTLVALFLLSWKAPAALAVLLIVCGLWSGVMLLFSALRFRCVQKKMRENMHTDWLRVLSEGGRRWSHVRHLVVFPVYAEPYAVVKKSLESLAASHYPLETIMVVLATEERGGARDAEIAARLRREFGDTFSSFLVTMHPAQVPGEIAGKGSNETFAVKQAVRDVIIPQGIPLEDVLVTVFDADTQSGAEYFGILTHAFLTAPHPQRSSYQPAPLFDTAPREVPTFARLAAHYASLFGFLQQDDPRNLMAFSSHSMPLAALVEVGYWHTDVIPDDSRIFFQCLNHFNGDWRAVPLLYPVSMHAIAGATMGDALRNLYKQQRRWAWGVENVPYIMHAFMQNAAMRWQEKVHWIAVLLGAALGWTVGPLIAAPVVFIFATLALGQSSYGLVLLACIMGVNMGGVTALVRAGLLKSPRQSPFLVEWLLLPAALIAFTAIPALDAQTRLMLGGKYKLGFWRTPKGSRIQEQ